MGKQTRKFKERDKVKIVSDIDSTGFKWPSCPIGVIGTITGVVDDLYIIDENKYFINFQDCMLELVEEESYLTKAYDGFVVGDRIRMKEFCSGCGEGKGYTLVLSHNKKNLIADYGSGEGCTCPHKWELVEKKQLITNSKKSMAETTRLVEIPEKIAELLSPAQKAFYRLGYIDDKLESTEKGLKFMNDFLFDTHSGELGELAIAELKKVEKEEKEAKKHE